MSVGVNVKGMHLWRVSVDGSYSSLWITTRRKDVETAIKKAKKFIVDDETLQYRGRAIKTVEHSGTLDA